MSQNGAQSQPPTTTAMSNTAQLSRAQRRAMDRAARKTTVKSPAHGLLASHHNLEIAKRNVALMTSAEIAQKIDSGKRAVEAFRTGRGTFAHWLRLCTHVNVGLAIETKGIVRGLEAQLMDAHYALQAISDRMEKSPGVWMPSALRATELESIRALVDWHAFQMSKLSYREYADAYNLAVGRITSSGGEVVDIRKLEASEAKA